MEEEQHRPDEIYSIPDEAFDDAIMANRAGRRPKRGKAHESSAWITGPGSVLLLVEAARDLIEISAARGEPRNRVNYVRFAVLPSIKALVVWPTGDKDPQGEEVTWRDGTAAFLASDLLLDAKLQVESGKSIRFPVRQVSQSKYGPILSIDMRHQLQVKDLAARKRRRKRRQGGQEGQ